MSPHTKYNVYDDRPGSHSSRSFPVWTEEYDGPPPIVTEPGDEEPVENDFPGGIPPRGYFHPPPNPYAYPPPFFYPFVQPRRRRERPVYRPFRRGGMFEGISDLFETRKPSRREKRRSSRRERGEKAVDKPAESTHEFKGGDESKPREELNERNQSRMRDEFKAMDNPFESGKKGFGSLFGFPGDFFDIMFPRATGEAMMESIRSGGEGGRVNYRYHAYQGNFTNGKLDSEVSLWCENGKCGARTRYRDRKTGKERVTVKTFEGDAGDGRHVDADADNSRSSKRSARGPDEDVRSMHGGRRRNSHHLDDRNNK